MITRIRNNSDVRLTFQTEVHAHFAAYIHVTAVVAVVDAAAAVVAVVVVAADGVNDRGACTVVGLGAVKTTVVDVVSNFDGGDGAPLFSARVAIDTSLVDDGDDVAVVVAVDGGGADVRYRGCIIAASRLIV